MTFYVIDGMDGVGKDTVADMLIDHLESQGRTVSCYKHPSKETVFGKIASESLLKDGTSQDVIRSLSYFMDLTVSAIRKKGDVSDDVIFVRYVMSALYLPRPMSRILHRIASLLLPPPDIGILVDTPAEIAMERIISRGEDLEIYENPNKLMTVRLDMRSVARSVRWHILDNRGDRGTTMDSLERIVRKN